MRTASSAWAWWIMSQASRDQSRRVIGHFLYSVWRLDQSSRGSGNGRKQKTAYGHERSGESARRSFNPMSTRDRAHANVIQVFRVRHHSATACTDGGHL